MKKLVLLALVVACGGGQTHPNMFATDWEDDGGNPQAHVPSTEPQSA